MTIEEKLNGNKKWSVDLTNVNNPRLKRIINYLWIKYDLHQLDELLDVYLVNKNPKLSWSIFVSLIISYGRLFNSGKERKMKLEPKDALKLCTKSQKELHYKLINWRNEYVAHASSGKDEFIQAFMVFHKGNVHITADKIMRFALIPEEIRMFKLLIENLLGYLKPQFQKQHDLYLKALTKQELEGFLVTAHEHLEIPAKSYR